MKLSSLPKFFIFFAASLSFWESLISSISNIKFTFLSAPATSYLDASIHVYERYLFVTSHWYASHCFISSRTRVHSQEAINLERVFKFPRKRQRFQPGSCCTTFVIVLGGNFFHNFVSCVYDTWWCVRRPDPSSWPMTLMALKRNVLNVHTSHNTLWVLRWKMNLEMGSASYVCFFFLKQAARASAHRFQGGRDRPQCAVKFVRKRF